ncbi:unnamed protein product [Caenorhabditis bovis]|uniref:PPM-type phosphatase domain-containing protein n=1 Tax=Caenorhabditis bovis TaxID=2654633 RepID=A0A8S1ETT7_9PELO|nr:unnamed protein product [Caenorhabditis bovis]
MNERKRTASESEAVELKKSKKTLFETIAAHGCRTGERDDMQDTFILSPLFSFGDMSDLSRCSFFAIFDGHAGSKASEFCQKHMETVLKEKLSKFEDLMSAQKALKSTFIETYKNIDEQFLTLAKSNKPVWKDGSTASTMLIINNTIFVANIGDSKAVVARQKDDGSLSPVCLTVDHNPMAHEERMRIQKTGAIVKDGRVNGIIEVSRSFGDLPFKNLGVTCVPDMKKLTLGQGDL